MVYVIEYVKDITWTMFWNILLKMVVIHITISILILIMEQNTCVSNQKARIKSNYSKELDIITARGTISVETTFVRTGGADDGGGAWSLAFTPNVDSTRDNLLGLIGPWMAIKITGDGTAQTVSVFIANSGAADYQDNDVWLEIAFPDDAGTSVYKKETTQMDLLDLSPADITNDTTSDWSTGAGGKQAQTLSKSISPDYVGRAYCRVMFAKNFGSSPETLYVDPLPVVS